MAQSCQGGDSHTVSSPTSAHQPYPLHLDTTGEYLSLRGKPVHAKSDKPGGKGMDETERIRLMKVFTDHAFQFLACADAILADPRLSCVGVPIKNGMAYTGVLPLATIGAYVELWTTSTCAAQFNKHGLSLTWFFSGSPLSGVNVCESVWQDGACRRQSPHGKFVRAACACGSACLKYQRLKQETCVEPYTLDEAAQWVVRQLTPEVYRKAIDSFAHQLWNRLIEEKQAECQRFHKEIDAWKKLYVQTVLLGKIDQVRQLVADFRKKERRLGAQIERLKRDNDELKARFPKQERGRKEFNTPFHRNNRVIERLKRLLSVSESSMAQQLFKDETPEGLNHPLDHEVENLCTAYHLAKFLADKK